MKIDVTQPVRGYGGKRIRSEGKKPFTLRSLFSNALNAVGVGEKVTAEDQARIYHLSCKIWRSKEVDLTLDERAFIKKRAVNLNWPLGYGVICDTLEDKKK